MYNITLHFIIRFSDIDVRDKHTIFICFWNHVWANKINPHGIRDIVHIATIIWPWSCVGDIVIQSMLLLPYITSILDQFYMSTVDTAASIKLYSSITKDINSVIIGYGVRLEINYVLCIVTSVQMTFNITLFYRDCYCCSSNLLTLCWYSSTQNI